MPSKSNSTLSDSSSSKVGYDIAPDPINPGLRPEETVTGEIRPDEPNWSADSDLDSDSYDAEIEGSFPASDPPSSTPVTGSSGDRSRTQMTSSTLPADFKDNPKAQFEYGRKSEKSTEHFDPSSHRLENGNPDVGNVDLGTIEADKPARIEKDTNDDMIY